MITLPGYIIQEEVYFGERSIVYRANKNGQPVIIKILRSEYPTSSELNAFKNEYELIKSLNYPSVVKAIGFEKYRNSFAIVFEDIGGKALSIYLENRIVFSLSQVLSISIKIARAIGEIHKAKMIHRDIKPHNIVLNEATEELNVIDFGSASLLYREYSFIHLNDTLEGTLYYISPEQTGRMNRNVDYRTDFYSLGITMYQLVTGDLPFIYSDPMELIHAHIAKTPISPFDKNGTNRAFSDVIMKLLEKNPEDRYQNIDGLVYDLEWCLENGTRESPYIPSLHIGANDFSPKFQIPEKLYGRNKEVVQIMKAFTRVFAGNKELLLISGSSGIGKTILINEVNKPIVERKGYFISGKYDQFKRSTPYRAITYAFQGLIEQLLTEKEDSIIRWKEKILKALGANAQLVIDVIPELENLIGVQKPVLLVEVEDSQNRFSLVFQNLFKVICQKEHPIAIFLDDLQWADLPSIKLIQSILLDPEIKHLLCMLSFRDNETLPTGSVSLLVENLKKENFLYKEIVLKPISLFDIGQLVSDTLSSKSDEIFELSEFLYERTKGNPFFVNELFRTLYEKKLIYFSENRWIWEMEKIQEEMGVTENVIDLMVSKIKELPDEKIDFLKLVACIGYSFKISVLIRIYEKELEEVIPGLISLANKGFFIVGGDSIKFVHDKIREATYTLISKEERERNHYAIGNAYLRFFDKVEIEENVFTIVSQLNLGMSLVTTSEEKERLLNLNHMAGNKALASSAYEEALQFMQNAIDLLPENPWEVTYELTLELYTKRARLAYLVGRIEDAEEYFSLILENVQSSLEIAAIYEIQIPMYVSQNKLREALAIGILALELLGVNFPESEDPSLAIEEVSQQLGSRRIEELLELPRMLDLEKSAAMRILAPLTTTAYIGRPSLVPLIALKMVSLSLAYGNHSTSPFGYIFYGGLLTNALGKPERGFEFGKMAIDLIERLQAKSIKPSVFFFFPFFISHWKKHAREGNPIFNEALEAAKEVGVFQYGSYVINNLSSELFLMGKELSSVVEQFNNSRPVIKNIFKQYDASIFFELWAQFATNLTGESKELLSLNGEYFVEETILTHWLQTNNHSSLFSYYSMKSVLCYLFSSAIDSYDFARQAESYEGGVFGTMIVPWARFFDSLTCLALLEPNGIEEHGEDNAKYLEQVKKNQERMRGWAKNCPANYGHKYHLVEGLLAVTLGDTDKARKEYKTAILLAKEYEYLLEEAIANECYAKLWRECGEELYSDTHLVEAHYAYERWGCNPKLIQLEEKFPHLKKQSIRSFNLSVETSITSSESISSIGVKTGGYLLDMNTVIKASLAISGEIQLEKLLEKMMKILIENAGAEKGFFLLKENERWYAKAIGRANTEVIEILDAKVLDDNSDLCLGVVNYVIHTKNIVILNDAFRKGIFVNDEYIRRKQSKSILCYPVMNQGYLLGLVYLENNLSTDAFTSDRLEILKILSSQIALSLENSFLYANLEAKVVERTKDLKKTLENLQHTQQELIQSEKMAALGQLIAGIAHEINTPIGAISSSLQSIQGFLDKEFMQVLDFFIQAKPEEREFMEIILQRQLDNKKFLSSKEKRIIKIKLEKILEENNIKDAESIADHLTDIGIHESIENFFPILKSSGVSLLDKIYKLSILRKGLRNIQLATDKTSKIVFALKNYSHKEASGAKTRTRIDLGMDTVLTLYQNVLNRGIELIKEYDSSIPEIDCYPDELNQVWINLIQNSIHAMDSKGKLIIRINQENSNLKVEIIDSGKGIPFAIQEKIFEPFFTTKPVGEGSGLGLGIIKKIIEKHEGTIQFQSMPGRTVFTVMLPITRKDKI